MALQSQVPASELIKEMIAHVNLINLPFFLLFYYYQLPTYFLRDNSCEKKTDKRCFIRRYIIFQILTRSRIYNVWIPINLILLSLNLFYSYAKIFSFIHHKLCVHITVKNVLVCKLNQL